MSKQQCPNNNCFWKYDWDNHKACPYCGTSTPEKTEEGVQAWNSTLKQYPSNRLSPRSDRRSSTNEDGNTDLQAAMRAKAQQWTVQSLQRYNAVVCQNCGLEIGEVKFHNVSHIEPRSTAPDKATDPDNMEVLCASVNFMGEPDSSCHTAWEKNRYEDYKSRTNLYRKVRSDD